MRGAKHGVSQNRSWLDGDAPPFQAPLAGGQHKYGNRPIMRTHRSLPIASRLALSILTLSIL
ncbi:hypothetical protein, partial [Achromobacter xylosoxidans]|uniref:hypothetical protein n=1 Tax=Alcaligenes xylosoxydans xylosoxydans TaxID=85698 RepID=UPI001A93BD13